MMKRLSISMLVGFLSIVGTFYSQRLEAGQPLLYKAINWSEPFWLYLYRDELLCTLAGYNKVMQGSIYTNGILFGIMAFLTLWLRTRMAELKLP